MGTTNKRWSYSAGERGRNRVRAFEDARSGELFLEWHEDGRTTERSTHGEAYTECRTTRKRRSASLGHTDRERAKAQADEAAARLALNQRSTPEIPQDITLRELFDIYGREVTPEKGARSQKHDRCCEEMFLRYFGPERKARTLNRRDWDAFIRDRRSGRIRPQSKRKASEVGNRTIARDLLWLRAVLNWATMARGTEGYLLERNPLKGLPIPREENPERPVMTQERYEAMLAVAGQVDWRFEVAFVLAHETGHRIKAIRHLRWSDIDLNGGWIHWRAGSDKIGHDHRTPLSEAAVEALRKSLQHNPWDRYEAFLSGDAEGPWLLPSPKNPKNPASRSLMRHYWHEAEKLAGLKHEKGLGWHGLRRMFATELKHVPLKDLCRLGGWKAHRTVIECYQQPDEETMRQALRRRVGYRLREAKTGRKALEERRPVTRRKLRVPTACKPLEEAPLLPRGTLLKGSDVWH